MNRYVDTKIPLWGLITTVGMLLVMGAGMYFGINSLKDTNLRFEKQLETVNARTDYQLETIKNDVRETNLLLTQRAVESARLEAKVDDMQRRIGQVEARLQERN